MSQEERNLWCSVYAAVVRSRASHQTHTVTSDAANMAADAVLHFRRALRTFA